MPEQQRDKKTILLVEDEGLIAVMQKQTLRKHGYNVITASNGEKAIEIVRTTPDIDLILMDINLGQGRMDGTEAAQIILKEKEIPVLFLSSYTQAEVVQKTEKITSYGYVVKDSGETVLITSIRMAFKLHKAHMKVLEREESLKASEEKYRRIVETANEGIWVSDKDNTIVFVNPRMASMLGYAPEEMIGKNLSDLIPKDGLEDFYNRMETRKRGIPEQFERRLLCKDGSFLWTIVSAAPIKDKNGNFQGSFAMVTDITERKQAEEALKKYSRDLGERVKELNCLYSISELVRKDCISQEEILRETASILAHAYIFPEITACRITWGEHEYTTENFRKTTWSQNTAIMVHGEQAGTIEVCYLEERTEEHEGPFVAEERKLFNAVAEFLGRSTERKQAEEALRSSRLQLSEAMDLAHIVYWESDPVTQTYVFNDPFYTFYGTTAEKEGGYRMAREDYAKRFIYPDDLPFYYQFVKENALRPGPELVANIEHRIVRRDGEVRHILARARVVKDDSGRIIRRYGANQDITDRKQAEDKIKASLRENEVLLKEIQHRVKNNLVTISGILAFQSERIKDSESKDAFITCMNRINTMTKIHTRLYQSEDFSRIGFRGYMEELIRELSRSYGFPRENIITDIQDIFLDINTAIPAGLIINELVSNAMKHAFPDGDKGQIAISLREEDGGSSRLNGLNSSSGLNKAAKRLVLTVSDNGIGLPDHIDLRSTESIGLSLVVQSVEQINGNIEVLRDNGTQFIITFSINLGENIHA